MNFEKNVPIPENYDGPRNNKYNYHLMEVGDSFSVLFEPVLAQKMRVALSQYCRRNNKEFTTRKVFEDGMSQLRVWRIS